MTQHTLTRRQFLHSTTRAGLTLTLATAVAAPVKTVLADEGPTLFIPVLRVPDVQELLGSGMGALWAAGQIVDTFARNLDFDNLPPRLRYYFRAAGGDWKSHYEGMRIWKTIPEAIRMGGAEEIDVFLKNKDWSHEIPRVMGGPSTADNGIFELSILNRIRGGQIMTPEEIAAAKGVIRSDHIRSVIRQTTNGMAKGAYSGIVVGGMLLCLEYGLLYAEGKIGWGQMVGKITEATIYGGIGAFITTGLIVGLALLFPVLLPIFVPLLLALQVVSMVFVGRHLSTLLKGWWAVLDGQKRLDDLITVLKGAKTALTEMFNNIVGNPLHGLWAWIERMGGAAWSWIASQTQMVQEKAGDFGYALAKWDYLPDLDVGKVGESIVRVVVSEFKEAISATEELFHSTSNYRRDANLKVAEPLAFA